MIKIRKGRRQTLSSFFHSFYVFSFVSWLLFVEKLLYLRRKEKGEKQWQ